MKNRKSHGFTLIEILVVVVIIAILASAVVLTMRDKPDQASQSVTKATIKTVATALEAFHMDMRRYPTQEEGLRALVKRPDSEDASHWHGSYIDRLPTDGWDRPLIYTIPGYHNPESYDLLSYGRDGAEGGQGFDADLGNWTNEE